MWENVSDQDRVPTKSYKLACAPIIDSDQPVHLRNLIIVFDGCSIGS